MTYKVTKQYTRGMETTSGYYAHLKEAQTFVRDGITNDALMKVKVVYRIYDAFDLLEEHDSSKVEETHLQETSSGSGKGNAASFRPTPLNTTPRPPGTPPKWIIDAEEEDKKK